MVKTAMLLGASNRANVVKQMNEVLQFERNLAKIYETKGQLKDSEKIYNKMTIADLQQMAPSVCYLTTVITVGSRVYSFESEL